MAKPVDITKSLDPALKQWADVAKEKRVRGELIPCFPVIRPGLYMDPGIDLAGSALGNGSMIRIGAADHACQVTKSTPLMVDEVGTEPKQEYERSLVGTFTSSEHRPAGIGYQGVVSGLVQRLGEYCSQRSIPIAWHIQKAEVEYAAPSSDSQEYIIHASLVGRFNGSPVDVAEAYYKGMDEIAKAMPDFFGQGHYGGLWSGEIDCCEGTRESEVSGQVLTVHAVGQFKDSGQVIAADEVSRAQARVVELQRKVNELSQELKTALDLIAKQDKEIAESTDSDAQLIRRLKAKTRLKHGPSQRVMLVDFMAWLTSNDSLAVSVTNLNGDSLPLGHRAGRVSRLVDEFMAYQNRAADVILSPEQTGGKDDAK